MQKVRKTIYITPETAGRLDFEKKQTGKRMTDLIEDKLSATYESDSKMFQKLSADIEELSRKLLIMQKQNMNMFNYLIKMNEHMWSGLRLDKIPDPRANESLQSFKESMKGTKQND